MITGQIGGLPTVYLHDAAKRQYGYQKYVAASGNPITYQNMLDAAGRSVTSLRIGTDNTVVTQRCSAYDTAGRLTCQTNALGGGTTYVESTDSSTGGLILTSTYPDTGTRIEKYYLDGTLKSAAGTAVHPVRYEYGAENDVNGNSCSYIKEIKIDGTDSGSEWTKTYTDMAGRTTEVLYADGSYSRSYYNAQGQLWKQVDPDGVTTLYQYNAKGERAFTAVSAVGATATTNDWNSDRITWTTNDVITDHGAVVRRTSTSVWAQNNVNTASQVSVSEASADGLKSWQVSYADAAGTVAVTNSTATSYAGSSRTSLSLAPDGSYTTNFYSYGRLISSARFDSQGNPIGSTSYTYDPHGRQYQVADARNGTNTYAYNAADQVSSVTTPVPGSGQSAETTTTLYDNLIRPYSVIQPDGTTVYSLYLLTGELGLQYGSRTYPVAYGYDYAGRMQIMTNWSSFNISNPTGARMTTWKYDGQRGWLTNKAYAGTNGPSYAYTPAGRLQTRAWVRTDGSANPITTTYNYDFTGSLTNTLYSDTTPSVTNSYDRLGRLTQQATANYQVNSTYNLVGQLLTETNVGGALNGLSVTNGYDQFLRRTNLSVLASSSRLAVSAYGYDNASRLSWAADGNGDLATNSYLANSPLVGQITFQQGTTTRMATTKSYDYLNRLTGISSTPTAGVAVNFNYAYNAANQRTKNTLVDGSYWVYQYDSLGQVTNGCKYFADGTLVPGQQFGYGFDTIGNRTKTSAGGDATGAGRRLANYSVNSLNQITSRDYPGTNDVVGVALATNTVTVNGQTAWRKGEYFWSTVKTNNTSGAQWLGVTVVGGGSTNTGSEYLAKTPEVFGYDADGNLTNDGRWSYTWDAENRLVRMVVNTNVGPLYQLDFGYDAKSRRTTKVVSSNNVAISTNKFVYDGWNLVAEVGSSGTLVRSYLWGNDLSGSQQGAGGVGGLLAVSYYGTSTTNAFPAFDGSGNVAALVNATNGTVVASYEYGPFGEVIRATGPMAKANPFRFSTKYQDDESDLLYYGYRYYKASTSTWLSRDPIGERGGFNLNSFPANDAINSWDVNGLAGLSDSEKKCCKCLVFAEGGSDDACQQAVLTVLASRQLYSQTPPGEQNPFPDSRNEGGFCAQSKKKGTFTGVNTDKYRYCMGDKCRKKPTAVEKKLYDIQIAKAAKNCDGLPGLDIPAGAYYWWNPDKAPTNERIMAWNIKIDNCMEIPTGCSSIKVYACNSQMKPEGSK